MSRIIVLGGCGYIGSALVPHLRAKGHDVDTCDIVGNANYLMDFRKLSVQMYDTVILLAAHSSVVKASADLRGAFNNNLGGLCGLVCDLLPEQRLIYASSASVYAVDLSKGSEGFKNIYDATKFCGDVIARLLRPKNTFALRFGTVCGASPNIRLDLIITRMCWSAIRNGYLEMSNPQVRRPILGMNDLCNAISVIVDGKVEEGIHNLSSFNTTVGEVANNISRILDCDIIHNPPTESYDFVMDRAKWMVATETIDSIVSSIVSGHSSEWRTENAAASR